MSSQNGWKAASAGYKTSLRNLVFMVAALFSTSSYAQICPANMASTGTVCPNPVFSEWTYNANFPNIAAAQSDLLVQFQKSSQTTCPLTITLGEWGADIPAYYNQIQLWMDGRTVSQDSRQSALIDARTEEIEAPFYCPAVLQSYRTSTYALSFMVRDRTISCPPNSMLVSTISNVIVCIGRAPACPVNPLSTTTDPEFLKFETGIYSDAPDVDDLNQATKSGITCIQAQGASQAKPVTSVITSGYRPAVYQTHLLEVYDKWKLLERNTAAACVDIKKAIEKEYRKHGPFAHRPGTNSNHSSKRAVDIALSSYGNADNFAAACGMKRPFGNADRVHFEPQ